MPCFRYFTVRLWNTTESISAVKRFWGRLGLWSLFSFGYVVAL